MERIKTFSMPSHSPIRIPGGGAEATITDRFGDIWLDMAARCVYFVPNQPQYRSRAFAVPFEALKHFDMPAALLDELSPPPEIEVPQVTSGRGRKTRAA